MPSLITLALIIQACVSISPYNTLGLPEKSGLNEVKKAFRKLSLQYHPDIDAGTDYATYVTAYEQILREHELVNQMNGMEEFLNYMYWNTEPNGISTKQTLNQQAYLWIICVGIVFTLLIQILLIKQYLNSRK
jgi:preprotein translocase subunit Sec63